MMHTLRKSITTKCLVCGAAAMEECRERHPTEKLDQDQAAYLEADLLRTAHELQRVAPQHWLVLAISKACGDRMREQHPQLDLLK